MFQLMTKRLLVIIGCLYMSVASANFEKGLALYQDNKFDEAFIVFRSLAEIGDYDSMFNLGVMYYRGEAVQQDKILAYAWIQTAGASLQAEDYLKTASTLLSSFNADEMQAAKKIAREFWSSYAPDEIGKHIFPKPLSDEDCTADPVILARKKPRYPLSELRAGRMGRVEAEFTISKEGYVRDLIVYLATNKNFMKSAVKSAKTIRYQPFVKNGQLSERYGIHHAFTFLLEGNPKLRTQKLNAELKEIKSKAEKGDAVSQYMYATRLNIFRTFKDYLENLNLEYEEANKWYLSSAKQGLPHAQFVLGRNMLRGQGCEVDKENGLKWIGAAAASGYSPAQHHIAQTMIQDPEKSMQHSAITWLRNAALSDHYPSKLLLAWELSTSSNNEVRNGKEALRLLQAEPDDYFDEVRILESYAVAYASTGDFKKAIKYQKKALKEAARLDWDIPVMRERLNSYKVNRPWRDRYYSYNRQNRK